MGRVCEYLPEEVLEEIMSWVPPVSLKRFKCVCKSWYVLINSLMNSSEFVARHLANMKSKRKSSPFIYLKNLVAINYVEGQESSIQENYMLTLVNADIDDDPLREGESDYIPCVTENLKFLTRNLNEFNFQLVSHCNGIICLSIYSEVVLLNPAIGEFKIIPKYACEDDSETDTRVVGFGYDPRSDDYKFVITKSLEVFEPGPYIAEIFTLSTNSWEEIEFDLDVHIPNCDYQVVYCNGFCYWYFWDWECTIVSFDIGDEVFQIIPRPKDVPMMPGEWEVITEWTKIAVWNDSLVLFFYTKLDPIVIDMWVMNACSGGVQGSYSWNKHLTIGPLEGINYPLAFWDDDELFMETKDEKIIFYNLRSQKLNDHSVWIEPYGESRFVTYTKSLVSVLKRDGR